MPHISKLVPSMGHPNGKVKKKKKITTPLTPRSIDVKNIAQDIFSEKELPPLSQIPLKKKVKGGPPELDPGPQGKGSLLYKKKQQFDIGFIKSRPPVEIKVDVPEIKVKDIPYEEALKTGIEIGSHVPKPDDEDEKQYAKAEKKGKLGKLGKKWERQSKKEKIKKVKKEFRSKYPLWAKPGGSGLPNGETSQEKEHGEQTTGVIGL